MATGCSVCGYPGVHASECEGPHEDCAPATSKLTAAHVVRVGQSVECSTCHGQIAKGDKAVKAERRAETYSERCHADKRGNVAWYRHPECAESRCLFACLLHG